MDYITLTKDIKRNNISNIYLFNAKDKYISKMMLKNLKDKLINPSSSAFNYSVYDDKKIDIDQVIERCETYPMFDNNRLVMVNTESIKGKNELSKMADYLKNVPEFTYIVFFAKKDLDKRGKLYKAIKKNGKIVDLEKFKGVALENWIRTKLQKEHIILTKDAVNYFIDASGYLLNDSSADLGYFAQEMEKLKFLDKKEIDLETIKSVISVNIEDEVFKLTDALRDKDHKNAFRYLSNLQYNKVNFLKILAVIQINLENMYLCKEYMAAKKTERDIVDDYHLHPYAVKMANIASKKYKKKDLIESIKLCFDLDYRIKVGQIKDRDAGIVLVEKIVNRG